MSWDMLAAGGAASDAAVVPLEQTFSSSQVGQLEARAASRTLGASALTYSPSPQAFHHEQLQEEAAGVFQHKLSSWPGTGGNSKSWKTQHAVRSASDEKNLMGAGAGWHAGSCLHPEHGSSCSVCQECPPEKDWPLYELCGDPGVDDSGPAGRRLLRLPISSPTTHPSFPLQAARTAPRKSSRRSRNHPRGHRSRGVRRRCAGENDNGGSPSHFTFAQASHPRRKLQLIGWEPIMFAHRSDALWP